MSSRGRSRYAVRKVNLGAIRRLRSIRRRWIGLIFLRRGDICGVSARRGVALVRQREGSGSVLIKRMPVSYRYYLYCNLGEYRRLAAAVSASTD